jgi:hypothetical protein
LARARDVPITAGMLRRTTTFAALAATALLAAAAPASAESADDKVTGGGTVAALDVPFTPFHFTVNARSDSGGASGRVTFHNADVSFTGDVQCLVQDGDTVHLAGAIEPSKTLAGGYYSLAIQDNGDTDLVAFNASGDTPLGCGQAGVPSAPLESGNVTVHGAR